MSLYRDAELDSHGLIAPIDASQATLRWVVPATVDEIKAADAFNAEMVRITGKSSAVEMRAIHAALCAGIGEKP